MKNLERSGPSSDLLRTFCAVAEAGSVTKAAAALGRTQSAVSVQVRNLEEHLTVRLFDRGARGVGLTQDGLTLLPAARKALREIDRAGALFAQPLAGQVRVGVPDDYGETLFARALARFAERHAEVEVFARSGCTAGFPDAVQRHELDLAVYSVGPTPAGQPFFSEPTVWAAGANFSTADDAPVPLVLFDRDCWWRDVATDALDQAGIAWRVAYLSENVVSVRAAISAGLGIGVLAASTLGPDMRVLDRSQGFPATPPSTLSLLKSERAKSDVVQAMEDAIRAAVGEQSVNVKLY